MSKISEWINAGTSPTVDEYIPYREMIRQGFRKMREEREKESYLERSIEILEECGNLIRKKGQDYQGGSVKDPQYYPHGWKSFDTMLTTKILRFRSVMDQEGNVNFDSAEDCLRDLINYSARCIVWLENERNK